MANRRPTRPTRGREAHLAFEALTIEGGLLSPAWLARVAQLGAGAQAEADYRVPKGLSLRDEIGRYWRIAQAYWAEYDAGRAAGADALPLADRFVQGLLREGFGFASLAPAAPVTIAGRAYAVGLQALGGRVPVVVAPAGSGLDTPAPAFGDGGRRRSAFGLAQEYLNAEDGALWGVCSDGGTLRILRDNGSMTRPAWIEADLGRIFAEQRYADFAALWLLAHESRFGAADRAAAECPLEAWRNAGREEGTRAREHLRTGVEDAIVAFGRGFLSHPGNEALRAALQDGSASTVGFFQELLRLAYRLIFLLTVEEREVLHPAGAGKEAAALYAGGYGMRRLRDRAVRRSAHDRYGDVWEAVKIVFRGLAAGEGRLGLPALGGLFAADQCPRIDAAKIENRALFTGIFRLTWLREEGALARVNWRDMGPEELGSVYESLLELVPQVTEGGRSFGFATGGETRGNARKLSGSYYTPDSLVQVLLDSALEPVVAATVAASPARAVEALLDLAVVDPACGSGHFLLAAGRRLAAHVARLRVNATPSAAEYRHALREVVGHCLFGVDLNPMAVELCKVSLWMEAVEPGRPLTFLDSHVQCGNALLGTTPDLLKGGIPNEAWDPIEGDDKKTASALKKQNKKERTELTFDFGAPPASTYVRLGQGARAVDEAGDESLAAVASKEQKWRDLVASAAYDHERFVADLWCAAFVWRKTPGALRDLAPTEATFRAVHKDAGLASLDLRREIARLREKHRFFHWYLAFPQVFVRRGFDIVLGNPPWIAHAGRAAQPIQSGAKTYYKHTYESFADYPTTHGMFVCLAADVLRQDGYLGLVIPSSLSELDSYEPTRRGHDRLCYFPGELVDFGEGQFPGVTQPCMALVSRRTSGGRTDAVHGEPWPMQRPDLDATARRLLERLGKLPCLPPELFAERGVQSDRTLTEHFSKTSKAVDRFTTPIREGADVREFQLLPPRVHVDPLRLGSRMRSAEEFQAVRIVIRQTARYPIAALSDGCAFRNSLLAAFENEAWPAAALVGLLNSALVRWLHYMRFRDARQPVMPQVKISHLRAIPAPPRIAADTLRHLTRIGEELSRLNGGPGPADREGLDALSYDMYHLDGEERRSVAAWHGKLAPRTLAEAADVTTEQELSGRSDGAGTVADDA